KKVYSFLKLKGCLPRNRFCNALSGPRCCSGLRCKELSIWASKCL
nr:RecName: Full=U2-agatoxin-Ao1s; Short=U2-AGTX-Ao1s; AltName: Full=Agel_18; Flags: Precursor [Agelena orientalis]